MQDVLFTSSPARARVQTRTLKHFKGLHSDYSSDSWQRGTLPPRPSRGLHPHQHAAQNSTQALNPGLVAGCRHQLPAPGGPAPRTVLSSGTATYTARLKPARVSLQHTGGCRQQRILGGGRKEQKSRLPFFYKGLVHTKTCCYWLAHSVKVNLQVLNEKPPLRWTLQLVIAQKRPTRM